MVRRTLRSLDDWDKILINYSSLLSCGMSKTQAAKELDIPRSSLKNKLQKSLLKIIQGNTRGKK